jgi:AcrR family transcriptional regulator
LINYLKEARMRRARAAGSESGGERRSGGPAATRQALVDAATELFAESGFDGVSIDSLAARAGVNKALVSYHFGGKRGLYVAALGSVFADLAGRIKAAEAEGRDVADTLHGLLQALAEFAKSRPAFPGLWLRELLSNGIEPALVPHLVQIAGVTRALAARGAREGVFRPVDPLLFHFGLIGPAIFFLATDPARRRASSEGTVPFAMPEVQDFLAYVEHLTLRGLSPAGARKPRSRKPAAASVRHRKGARA